jgi:PIN domain nuclease of toxin-antitoxin system
VNKYVLDASAVLALLNRESGQEKVEAILGDSVISAVNLSEVASKLIDAGLSDEEARETIDLLNVDVISFDVDQAHLAAMLRAKTKKLGLSLGDRSCLALGLSRQQTVVTAEREWAKLRIGVEIEIIR